MAVYPVNLDLTAKPCAVIGGGAVALRKTSALLLAGADVTVISPALAEPLAKLAEEKKIRYRAKAYGEGDLADFFLVICAADDAAANRAAARDAKAAGALVNIADRSFPSDFTVPAQVARGDLLITVSTGGQSPAVARQIRRELAERYGDEYGVFLRLAAKIRSEMRRALPDSKARERFWRRAMRARTLDLVRQGKLNEAEAEIRNAIGSFRSES